MCTNILNGEVLDHNPLKQGAYAESQPVRYQRMLDRYKALFAMPPPQPYWEVPVSAVETMDNPSPTYSESSSTPATSEVTPGTVFASDSTRVSRYDLDCRKRGSSGVSKSSVKKRRK